MKCPLIRKLNQDENSPLSLVSANCLKEECAWWDDGHPGCANLTIAQELATKRQKEEVEL